MRCHRRHQPALSGLALLCLLVSFLFTAGSAGQALTTRPAGQAAHPADPGFHQTPVALHVVHLPGILGPARVDRQFLAGLSAGLAGTDRTVTTEIVDWVAGRPPLEALRGREQNEQTAHQLADRLRQFHREYPDAHIILTAHSGGVGVATWTAEALAQDNANANAPTLAQVVYLAGALSPAYDLTHLSRSIRFGVLNFVSQHDSLILGFGTRQQGTIDRVFTNSAGMVGLLRPGHVDPEGYGQIWEVPYDPTFGVHGHHGHHVGMMTTTFAREVVAPLMLSQLGLLPEEARDTLPTTRPIAPARTDRPSEQ